MTEDEAKTKWCPFARVMFARSEEGREHPVIQRSLVGNRVQAAGGAGDHFGPCIASDCMAWRWIEKRDGRGASLGHSDDGFCGLAGAPTHG